MRLELDVFGDTQLSRDLLRFGERAADASPAFRQIADDLRDIERRQFASEGGFASAGWDPLAPSTIARKALLGLDPRILRATGALEASLTNRGDDAHVEMIGTQELIFGTDVDYAKFHQKGTSRMPRRRPIELRETDRRDIVRTLQRHLVGER